MAPSRLHMRYGRNLIAGKAMAVLTVMFSSSPDFWTLQYILQAYIYFKYKNDTEYLH